MKLCFRLRPSTHMSLYLSSIYYSYLTEIMYNYYKCSLGLVEAKIKTTKPWEQHCKSVVNLYLVPPNPSNFMYEQNKQMSNTILSLTFSVLIQKCGKGLNQ